MGQIITDSDRGTTLSWKVASFEDNFGNAVVPQSVELYVSYRVARVANTANVAMTHNEDDSWTASWNSDGVDAGPVFWTIKATNPNLTKIGSVNILTNPSTP